jgi:hypothetical protein
LIGSGSAETTDGALLWRKVIRPQLDDYMGEVFESVCRDFVYAGKAVKYALFSRHAPVDPALREEIASGRVTWLGLDNLLPKYAAEGLT